MKRWYKLTFTDSKQKGRYAMVVAFLLAGVSYAVLLSSSTAPEPETIPVAAVGEMNEEVERIELASPNRLVIPKLEIDTTFTEPLGLQESGEVEVPSTFDQVGWYRYSPPPGALGPSIILGHVDSYEGPAVFWSLGQLEAGDEVLIEREDGTNVTFVVTKLERYEQADFPTDLVYGNIDHSGMRLITCSGTYNHDEARYTHNLVVFAEMLDDKVGENID